jgi:hypothetical protein
VYAHDTRTYTTRHDTTHTTHTTHDTHDTHDTEHSRSRSGRRRVPSSSLMRNFLESQLTVNGMGFQACLKIVSVALHACSAHPHAASVVSIGGGGGWLAGVDAAPHLWRRRRGGPRWRPRSCPPGEGRAHL